MEYKIRLTNGYFTLVDREDYEKYSKFNWYLHKTHAKQYVRRSVEKYDVKRIYLHREIVNAPEGMEVDHINGDTLDNRQSNLRICTHAQNLCNSRLRSDNSSGYRGVYFRNDKRKKKWLAQIRFYGKSKHIGYYLTAKDAASAFNDVALQIHGEFARLNEI